MSLSARRAWIEIIDYIIDYVNDAVALRKESVDRNRCKLGRDNREIKVALRKESVDRNSLPLVLISPKIVALRKESVDRNNRPNGQKHINSVALRKESVDRNSKIAKKY